MSDALARVKSDLGKGAVILHTRSIKRGGLFGLGGRSLVEITATNDPRVAETRAALVSDGRATQSPALAARNDGRSPPDARLATDAHPPIDVLDRPLTPWEARAESKVATPQSVDDQVRREILEIRNMVEALFRKGQKARTPQAPAELLEYYTHLIGQDVAEELAEQLLGRLCLAVQAQMPGAVRWEADGHAVCDRPIPAEWVREELCQAVREMLPLAEPLKLAAEGRPTIVALVGPTGVGKTTTIAKLAANMKLREGRKVGLITIDTYRIAAVEQLKTYAQILKVPLAAVVTPEDVRAAIARMSDLDLILIDTAGRSQRDEPRIAELGDLLAAAKPDQVHLVLSTTSSETAIREAVGKFSALGARHLIFTKLDEAVGFGVVLNVLKSVDLRLSYLTNGQSVPNDIEEGSARRVAQLILGGEPRPVPAMTVADRPEAVPTVDLAAVGEGI